MVTAGANDQNPVAASELVVAALPDGERRSEAALFARMVAAPKLRAEGHVVGRTTEHHAPRARPQFVADRRA